MSRRFDWDEARRLRAEGMTYVAIAERLGVSDSAVAFACDWHARARNAMAKADWQRQGRCPDCGAQTSRTGGTGDHRCRDCADLLRATSVRPTELMCFGCREWKPDPEFPFNRAARKARRGRHNFCRGCGTLLRQAARERVRVPCARCGSPRLPASEKGAGRKDSGLCLACYRTRKRVAA